MVGEAFNRAPQEQPQYPYFWQRPTQEPRPDLSGKIAAEGMAKALGTAGKSLGESVAVADKAEERGIMNDVYAQGDALMNRDIQSLYQDYQGIQGTPKEVSELPKVLGTLRDARDNGKISNTDHDARIDSLAKQLRAKYPGYRPEVDEYLRAATGRGSTANQLYQSLREDIDASTAARRANKSKVETELWGAVKEGIPGASARLQLFQAGKIDEGQVAGWLEKSMSFKYKEMQDNAKKASLELQNIQDTRIGKMATDSVSNRAFHNITTAMDTWLLPIGGGKEESLFQISKEFAAGTLKIAPDQLIALRLQADAAKAQLWSQAWQAAHKAEPGQRSDAERMGGDDKLKEKLTAAFQSWDNFVDFIAKGDITAASATKFQNEVIRENAANERYTDPKTAAISRNISALEKLGPAVAPTLIGPIMQDQNFNSRVREILLGSAVNFATPETTSGYKETFQKTVEQLKQVQAPPEAYKQLLDIIGLIPNTSFPFEARVEIAKSLFGVDQNGIVGNFSAKPNAFGNTDQQTIFNGITDRKFVDQVHKLASESPVGVALWDKYQKFAENNWQTLVASSLATINEEPKYLRLFDFGYDFDRQHLVLKLKKTVPGTVDSYTQRQQQARLQMSLDRINSSIDHMKHIYEPSGVDMNVPIMKLLMASGTENELFVKQILDSMKSGFSSQ